MCIWSLLFFSIFSLFFESLLQIFTFRFKRARIWKCDKNSKLNSLIMIKYSKINYFSWGIHFLQCFRPLKLILVNNNWINFLFLAKWHRNETFWALFFLKKIIKITMSPKLPKLEFWIFLNHFWSNLIKIICKTWANSDLLWFW